MNNRYTYLSRLLKHWEHVWEKDYLASLCEKFYGAQAADQHVTPRVGDVVLVQCEGPRISWPLGRITALLCEKENKVCIAEVYSKGITSKRTLDKCIPLELHCEIESNTSDEVMAAVKPIHQAAQRAVTAIKDILGANLLYIVNRKVYITFAS